MWNFPTAHWAPRTRKSPVMAAVIVAFKALLCYSLLNWKLIVTLQTTSCHNSNYLWESWVQNSLYYFDGAWILPKCIFRQTKWDSNSNEFFPSSCLFCFCASCWFSLTATVGSTGRRDPCGSEPWLSGVRCTLEWEVENAASDILLTARFFFSPQQSTSNISYVLFKCQLSSTRQ